jgi:methionyl-tRNA formyltransferase
VIYPDCYCFLEGGERVKMLRVRVCEESTHPGQVIHPKKLQVDCGEGSVEILELINPKGKKVRGEDFMRGYRPKGLF